MAKNLVIVESPAKAATIEKFLGKDYKVLASVGHLRDLPKSTMGVDLENNFEPKYINIRGKGDKIKELKAAAKKAEKVLLATDPDREGEAIAWHLAHILGVDIESPCRVVFHEITKSTIKSAIKNTATIDMNLVDAQQGRRVLDRLVGYTISPILWRKLRKGLSAGRVQSVATRLIVDRENEIRNFVSVEYWTVKADLINSQKNITEFDLVSLKGKKPEINDEESVNKIEEALLKEEFLVKSIGKKVKKRSPYPPFTTSSLQQEASNRLGFTTKKTMMIAQQLYEGIAVKGEGTVGLITYMRTDSTRISDEAKESIKNYVSENLGDKYLNSKARKQKDKKNAQDAHEAIRPTSVERTPAKILDSLSKDALALYRLIWERFVASEMADAEFDSVTVDVQAGDYGLRANGSVLKFDGFMKIYSGATYNDRLLPEFVEGEKLSLKDIQKLQHFTQPPARYTEASLVKEMEEKGIGRPSTYSPTISTILSRGYVEREKKNLKPTELGEIINEIMVTYFPEIVNVDFTAGLENKLDGVESGDIQWKAMISEFYQPFEKTVQEADEKIEKLDLSEKTDIECEKCGSFMNIKQGKFGKFLACSNYPECKNTKAILTTIGIKCPLCGEGDVVERKTKKMKSFYGCSRFPDCRYVSWDKPTGEKCPECSEPLVSKTVKGQETVKCSNKECKYKK